MVLEIIKSKYDNRKYKIITLKNNLEVMLISDKDTNTSSVSMNVGVGCFQDPSNIPGLAHFLEHMLFMGTSKYPNENDFFNYLSKNNGISNAFTSPDSTNYHFEINSSAFNKALDRFAYFFISPLFKKDSIDKEMNAINSEHSKNLQNNTRRILSVLRILSKNDHLTHKFCTGNLETLKEIPKKNKINIYNELLKFYKKYYSSNIMKLVVLDNDSLQQMEKKIKIFEKINNNNVQISKNNIDPYKDQLTNVIINPTNDNDTLEMFWSINSKDREYFRTTLYFICEMLEYKGNHSFLSFLKKEGYIYNLDFSYMNYNNLSYYLSYVSINLTKKGLNNIDTVISLIYEFIEYVKNIDKNIIKSRFKDLNSIAALNFMFKEKEEPLDYVINIAQNMAIYPRKYYLVGDDLMRNFKFNIIQDILNKILNKKSINMILSKDIFNNNSNNKINKEYYYGTEYIIQKKPNKIINTTSLNISNNIKFPKKNKYIPTDFTIKNNINNNNLPSKILDNKLHEVWFKQDNIFNKPFVYLQIELINPIAYNSPKNTVLNSLLINIWNDILIEKFYSALNVGNIINLSSCLEGFIITLFSYSSLFINLFNDLFNEIIDGKIDKKIFDNKKNLLKKYYKNIQYKSPLNQAYIEVYEILIENYIYNKEKIKVIDSITYDDLLNYKKELFTNIYFKFLFHGNIIKSDALEIINIINNKIKFNKISHYPKYKIIKLENKRIIYSKKSTNKNENDSVIASFYQFGKLNYNLYLLVEILQSIISEPYFNQLRTKEQLGYIVQSKIIYFDKIIGLVFFIQSSVKGPNYLLDRIDNFLKNFRNTLEKMTNSEFTYYIKSIINSKKKKYSSLSEEFNFYSNEIKINEYKFNRKIIDIQYLNKIKKNQIIELYDKFITNKFRNLVIKIIGKCGINDKCLDNDSDNYLIKSLTNFKKNSKIFS